jgi:preprotein translocase subunit SecA
MLKEFREKLYYTPDLDPATVVHQSEEDIADTVTGQIEAEVLKKVEAAGEDQFNEFIRWQYLRQIDQRWQDHLDELEALREAVYLRTYGQKNPLLEYKLEGFDIFDTLIYNIRTHIASLVINVEVREPDTAARRRSPARVGQAAHRQLGQFASGITAGGESAGGGGPARGGPQGATPDKAQVTRSYPKVGRNDPCPCGSGKKYKHCHGR